MRLLLDAIGLVAVCAVLGVAAVAVIDRLVQRRQRRKRYDRAMDALIHDLEADGRLLMWMDNAKREWRE